jgi:hypothetical protein
MDKSGKVFMWFSVAASLVLIVLVVFLIVQISETKNRLEAQMFEIEQTKEEMCRMQTLNEKIYQTVVSSLEARDSTRQEVARALLTAMDDVPVREQLLHFMNESDLTVASVKKRINHILTVESTFEFEEESVPKHAGHTASEEWKKWNYDIFFLEEKESDSVLSNVIKAHLLENGYEGRIRVRVLPQSINMRSGYHVKVPEVRYNTWEKKGAEQVLQLLEGSAAAREVSFSLRTVSMNTPNYISIFVVR